MPELSGLLAARTRLRPGSQGHREYRGQHLRRSGFGRYGQDVERALRQDRAAADLKLAGNDNLTTSTNTRLDSLIPASKISNLSQGMFVGAVADNFDERIEQKIFHAEIFIDREKLAGRRLRTFRSRKYPRSAMPTAWIVWRRSSDAIIRRSRRTSRRS